ncbi:alpha-keto acid decarboxylase family protein [Corynebacterium aquilae]|uniref:Alpha-keto-acid decarboxylase n=1 Tax=Corynebacterium aquilae DSM 44791 TaxID=1431546 RepID=A0A1L7CDM2_9CORY|nr:thiamine pyrophosphate-binding protein [Corynebacterium aquilae]APT83929.1 indolepyruvate decarboxylase [Corynebacterium aquilae DSM 44791]
MSSTYTVADYLFDRIAETGIDEIFGVPGDFNLSFLDNILNHEKLRWVGNNNELNAGYCADGYARLRGFAAMVTTFGVGELSAINATGGSYAENVPVLHIVGAPVRFSQENHLKVHHTLADGDYRHFYEMAKHVTCAQAWITPDNAATEIDRVIRTMLIESRPGYLVLSPDVAAAEIARPMGHIRDDIGELTAQNSLKAFEKAATEFLAGKKTTIVADRLIERYHAQEATDKLIASCDLPYATLPWSIGVVDNDSPRFVGAYWAAVSPERTRRAVEEAERLITIGALFTDTATAGFSAEINEADIVSIDPLSARVGHVEYGPIAMADAIEAVTRAIAAAQPVPQPLADIATPARPEPDQDAQLRQDDLWDLITTWLPSESILVADLGTSMFGLAGKPLPKGAGSMGQPVWASIGFALPASLGASLAEPDRRTVLVSGDGAAQLTVQEISTMLREKTNPLMLIINNAGYTVERAIHGPDALYNDIPQYNWPQVPIAMGGDESNTLVLRASTPAELKKALAKGWDTTDKLVMIEVMMDRDDVPTSLANFTATVAQGAKKNS